MTLEQHFYLSKLPAGKPGKAGEPRSIGADLQIALECEKRRWIRFVWCFDGMVFPVRFAEAKARIQHDEPGELKVRLTPAGRAARDLIPSKAVRNVRRTGLTRYHLPTARSVGTAQRGD